MSNRRALRHTKSAGARAGFSNHWKNLAAFFQALETLHAIRLRSELQ